MSSTDLRSHLASFASELRRRRVGRVAAGYAVAAWAAVEIADTVVPNFRLPAWIVPGVIVTALAGFPLAVLLAWLFDVTSGGVRRTAPGPGGPRGDRTIDRYMAVAVALAMAVSLAAASWLFLLIPGDPGPSGAAAPSPGPGVEPVATSSVAVLPFTDLSPGGDQAYFADGLADEVMTLLGQVPGLLVAGRASTFLFGERSLPLERIADSLGVAAVLDGSVRRGEGRLRVNARLVSGEDGFQLWSATFDGDAGDVFAVQDSLARAIAEALRLEFPASSGAGGTRSLRAHDLFLRAEEALRDRRVGEARDLYRQAVDQDPGYARAWAGLSAAWSLAPLYTGEGRNVALGEATRTARRSLELDPRLGIAHRALAIVLQDSLDFAGADAAYRRAIEFGPSDATASQWYSAMLSAEGRFDEAIAYAERAGRLDPLNTAVLTNLGTVYARAGRWDEADSAFAARREVRPNPIAVFFHAWLSLVAGRPGRALEIAAESQDDDVVGLVRALASARDDPGAAEEADRRIAMAPPGTFFETTVVGMRLWLGDEDGALTAIEELAAERMQGVQYLLVEPGLEAVHDHPRFLRSVAPVVDAMWAGGARSPVLEAFRRRVADVAEAGEPRDS